MKWSIEYSTGFAEIDKQHKKLFQMSEDYRVALTEGRGDRVYGLLLKSLGAYASAHFGREEGCMARFHALPPNRTFGRTSNLLKLCRSFNSATIVKASTLKKRSAS